MLVKFKVQSIEIGGRFFDRKLLNSKSPLFSNWRTITSIMILLIACLLPLGSSFLNSKLSSDYSKRYESRGMDEALVPLSGFITASINGRDGMKESHLIIKVLKRINKPTMCSSLEFRDLPSFDDISPLHSEIFNLLPGTVYNGRQAWSNGRDILSYVRANSDMEGEPYGTWIVGDVGGVDSGFAYIKPTTPTMTPLEVHTTHGIATSPLLKDISKYTKHWYWLRGKDWIEASNVTIVCLDHEYAASSQSISSTSSFYKVQFFSSKDTDVLTNAVLQLSVDGTGTLSSFHDWGLAESSTTVTHIVNARSLCAFGQPVLITVPPRAVAEGEIAPPNRVSQQVSASLVTDEVSSAATFRLIFRVYDSADSAQKSETEIVLEYGGADGTLVSKGYSLAAADSETESQLEKLDGKQLATVTAGDFVWLWWYPTSQAQKQTHASPLQHSDCPIISEQSIDEIFLRCTFRSPNTAVFQRYDTDRSVQMQQSILSRDTDLWIMTFDENGWVTHVTSKANIANRSSISCVHCVANIRVSRSIVVGNVKQTISFLQNYLEYKDEQHKQLSVKLSSCYFYHAAVSMPKALIYAAEVLCVLLGYKPLTMIQYTSPSELQWKFPLMAELSRGVVTVANLPDRASAGSIRYAVTQYRSDETLVIFRPEFEYVHRSLLPFMKAQALHPIPYPNIDRESTFDEDAASGGYYLPSSLDPKSAYFKHRNSAPRKPSEPDLEWAWSRQIFFSWWNGYVLGYPQHFINSYCESFHNGLDVDEKRLWSAIAKKQVVAYFKNANLSREVIGKGLLPPISEAHLDLILDASML